MRVEIKEVETIKTIKKINETKGRVFLEKANKIDKPLSRITKKKRQRRLKVRNERNIITDTTEIQRIMRN